MCGCGGGGREGGGKEREQLVGITFLLPGALTLRLGGSVFTCEPS